MPRAGLLGKRPARHDRRTLQARNYITIPLAQRKGGYGGKVRIWGMDGNDAIGDCTIAAEDHGIRVTSACQGPMQQVAESDVRAKYSQLSGYDPRTGANDVGCVVLDVLKDWQHVGLAGHKALAYAQCDVRNDEDVAACIESFGFVYIGFAVPRYAMAQFEAGKPWDLDPSGDQTIIGGHAIIGTDWDFTLPKRQIAVSTWGATQLMTLDFWHQFVDEAYGVVLPEWLDANQNSPLGVNVQQLLQDVGELQQQPTPQPAPVASHYLPLYQWLRGEGPYAAGGALAYCEADPGHDAWYRSVVVPTQQNWVSYYGHAENPAQGLWQFVLDRARGRKHKAPDLPPIPKAA